MLTLLTTGPDLTVVGDPIACWTRISSVLRFNAVSSGQADLPAYPWILDQIQPGRRMVLIRDGQVWCAGPIVSRRYRRTTIGDASGVGAVTVTWADDLARIAARITFPDPALPVDEQPSVPYTLSGNAEVALRTLTNLNAGPGALPARQAPGLVLGDLQGVGSSIAVSTRFEALTDVLRSAALAGGGLGFRTTQPMNTAEIVFDVYQPADLSGMVRFSFGLGNLREVDYTTTAPTATAAIVSYDETDGVSQYAEYINSDADDLWGRYETFVDQGGSDDPTEVDQAGAEALIAGGETAQLTTVTVDTDTQRYGVHYQLGDRVSVEVWPGQEVADLVRAVQLDAGSDTGFAERLACTIGTQEASSDPKWVALVRSLGRRIGRLEAR